MILEDSAEFADVLGAEIKAVANPAELRAFLDSLPRIHSLPLRRSSQDRSAAVLVCVAELYDGLDPVAY